jgi:hypothetical protein
MKNFDQERSTERAGDPGGVETEHHQTAQIDPAPELFGRDEGRDDQGVDRDARRARHQRGDQDRGKPVAAIVDHACRHDAGDGTGEAREQRDEGPAVQARATHDAIHQESRARHVAEIFEKKNEQEDDHDLGQEHNHAADARNHAVLKEALQQTGRQGVVHQLAEGAEGMRQQFHERLRPGKDRLKHDEERQAKDDDAGHRVQHHGIDPRGPGVGSGRQADGRRDDAVGLALGRAQVGDRKRLPEILP